MTTFSTYEIRHSGQHDQIFLQMQHKFEKEHPFFSQDSKEMTDLERLITKQFNEIQYRGVRKNPTDLKKDKLDHIAKTSRFQSKQASAQKLFQELSNAILITRPTQANPFERPHAQRNPSHTWSLSHPVAPRVDVSIQNESSQKAQTAYSEKFLQLLDNHRRQRIVSININNALDSLKHRLSYFCALSDNEGRPLNCWQLTCLEIKNLVRTPQFPETSTNIPAIDEEDSTTVIIPPQHRSETMTSRAKSEDTKELLATEAEGATLGSPVIQRSEALLVVEEPEEENLSIDDDVEILYLSPVNRSEEENDDFILIESGSPQSTR